MHNATQTIAGIITQSLVGCLSSAVDQVDAVNVEGLKQLNETGLVVWAGGERFDSADMEYSFSAVLEMAGREICWKVFCDHPLKGKHEKRGSFDATARMGDIAEAIANAIKR